MCSSLTESCHSRQVAADAARIAPGWRRDRRLAQFVDLGSEVSETFSAVIHRIAVVLWQPSTRTAENLDQNQQHITSATYLMVVSYQVHCRSHFSRIFKSLVSSKFVRCVAVQVRSVHVFVPLQNRDEQVTCRIMNDDDDDDDDVLWFNVHLKAG